MCRMSFKKETPLANAAFWAARRGNLALLRLLLNSGRVDVDCRDSVRWTRSYTRARSMPRPPAGMTAPPKHVSLTVLYSFMGLLALSFSKSPGYRDELNSVSGKQLHT
uniref:Ankyrin repeat domain 29 n=1 Tax=Molossus molossus TaxID=27622 RepID=A0A7J8HGC2_MOLMO|nr:ankyrin repeat domain 29 [Molossus molossus]